MVGLVLKRVADGEWRVFWDRQSIGLGKLRTNVTPHVAFNQRMVFEPFLLVVVHFPQKSRMYAWIPSVLNIQKQH